VTVRVLYDVKSGDHRVLADTEHLVEIPDEDRRDYGDYLAVWEAPDSTATAFVGTDALLIMQGIGQMPYGGGLHRNPLSQRSWKRDMRITAADVVAYFGDLAATLKAHVEREQKRDAEIMRLQRLIAGGRKLLAELVGPLEPTITIDGESAGELFRRVLQQVTAEQAAEAAEGSS